MLFYTIRFLILLRLQNNAVYSQNDICLFFLIENNPKKFPVYLIQCLGLHYQIVKFIEFVSKI
jgi:hypothetical protein